MKNYASVLAAVAMTFSSAALASDNGPIKIGVINDGSGVYADVGGPGSAAAAQMAVDEFGGELLGRKIQVIHADHQNKPDIANALVRKWIDVEKVSLLADGGPSSTAAAIQELSREKKFVYVNSGGFSSTLTGAACAPQAFQFAPDTYALASALSRASVERGLDSWFFLTADYGFGHALQRDASTAVKTAGGKVVGNVMHPLNSSDFSSFLLQAQASKAKAVGLANAGGDFSNALKQAQEFGLTQSGQSVVGFLVMHSDVQSIGLAAAKGLQFATATYWDTDAKTREWSEKFMKLNRGKPPTMIHSLTYSGVLHWLKAAKAVGSLDGEKIAEQMRADRVNDTFVHNAEIRKDGRVLEDLMLVEVKSPSESKQKFDDMKILGKIAGATAYRPLADGGCPLVQAAK